MFSQAPSRRQTPSLQIFRLVTCQWPYYALFGPHLDHLISNWPRSHLLSPNLNYLINRWQNNKVFGEQTNRGELNSLISLNLHYGPASRFTALYTWQSYTSLKELYLHPVAAFKTKRASIPHLLFLKSIHLYKIDCFTHVCLSLRTHWSSLLS